MDLKKISDSLTGVITIGNENDYSNLKLRICPNSNELFEPIREELEKLPTGTKFEYLISNSKSKSAYKTFKLKNIHINLFKI